MTRILGKLILLLLTLLIPLLLIVLSVDGDRFAVFNDPLEQKIRSLCDQEYPVVIAGDSRAERQVVPASIAAEYHVKTVNIATPSCDITTLYNALKKYRITERPTTFIVSASIFQVNDGAIDQGYISMAQVSRMSLLEKVRLFGPGNKELYASYLKQFLAKIRHRDPVAEAERETFENLGYSPHQGELEKRPDFGTDPVHTRHPWYKCLNIQGARWRVFQETLREMSKCKCTFIIYQPPVSEAFRRYVHKTPIEAAEMEYSGLVRDEVSKYRNIHFVDYFAGNPAVLSDRDYYDPQHLNDAGARKFTKYLFNDLIQRSFGQNGPLPFRIEAHLHPHPSDFTP